MPAPNTPSPEPITHFLEAWSRGDEAAQEPLFELVYDHLWRLAASQIRQERGNHTLETRALVHEMFLRLIDQRSVQWQDRAHFFAIAARIMRRVLVDHARRHRSKKRGGETIRLQLDAELVENVVESPDLIVVDEALKDLETRDPELAQVILLRVFGGLTKDEAAVALGLSPRTVARRWRLARAWLYAYWVEEQPNAL